MRAPILKAEDLWYTYDGRSYVLQGLDLEVRHGTVTMILGKSGGGKTTLLKALAGLLKPQKGTVAMGLSCEGGTFSGRRIAYIPQTLGLVRSMTALENTLCGALGATGTLRSALGIFPAKTVSQARATLASLGIGDKWDRPVWRLSGGERQRVAIARALMQKPELVLADEFVSLLDPITADEILQMTRKLAAKGIGFLVSTHEFDVVENYADDFAVMRDGRIVHTGAVGQFDAENVRKVIKG